MLSKTPLANGRSHHASALAADKNIIENTTWPIFKIPSKDSNGTDGKSGKKSKKMSRKKSGKRAKSTEKLDEDVAGDMGGGLPTFNRLNKVMESSAAFRELLFESLRESYCDPGSSPPTPSGELAASQSSAASTSKLAYDEDQPLSATDIWTAIENDDYVKSAFERFNAHEIKPGDTVAYGLVGDVGNAMSLAYVNKMFPNAADDFPVVFFDSPHDFMGYGDFLGEASEPDWVCYLVRLSVLKNAVQPAASCKKRVVPLSHGSPQFLATAELKPDEVDLAGDSVSAGEKRGQFFRFLGGHKRYRPDLTVVHGFLLAKNDVTVASIDPCGIIFHPTTKRTNIHIWISFVVLVYDSAANRDRKIEFMEPDAPHIRYSVDSPSKGAICCVPFYSAKGPGRMTWAAFEVESTQKGIVCKEDCQGFIKVSWQDRTSAGRERKLFNKAHKDTWLPGLARNWDVSEDEENVDNRETVSADGVTRVKEVMHLGSVGDPLSQCTSALHAFMLFFDLVGVHLEMVRRRILHRDISWFNILCNPWHHPGTTKIKQPAKASEAGCCLEYVLTGDEDAQPCVLLTDLDHGADMLELYEETYVHRKQRTGTPMFIALELGAGDKPILYRGAVDPGILLDALRDAENFGSYYKRMFPVENPNHKNFMTAFEKVVKREQIRRRNRTEVYTNPNGYHLPMHDVESMFWSFLWLFIRALPEGFDPEPNSKDFIRYVTGVLRATIGDERMRADRLFIHDYTPYTHEELHIWLSALEDMAIYFSIPWRLYHHEVSLEHAHIAVRRLLFSAMLRRAGQNVRFNCSQPRSAWEASNSSDRQSIPLTRDSQLPPTVSRASASKRKTLDDGERIASSSKRLKLDSSAASQPSTLAPQPAPKPAENPAENPAETPGQQLAKKPAQKGTRHCCSKDGCNAISVGARCEKMWNDRFLWFGVGKTKPNNKVKKSNDNGGIEVVGDVVDEDGPLETSHVDNIEKLLVAARAQFKLTEQKGSMATDFVDWNPRMAL